MFHVMADEKRKNLKCCERIGPVHDSILAEITLHREARTFLTWPQDRIKMPHCAMMQSL